MQDLRFALRQLLKNPGFTATALLTLAVGIGANLAIFAVVDAVLLRPLPIHDGDRLVALYNSFPNAGRDRSDSSQLNYTSRRGKIGAFSHLSALRHTTAVAGDAGATESIDVTQVSHEFFETLGVNPALGRAFAEAETAPGAGSVVMLTDGYWRRHFQADPAVIGQTLRVDGTARAIVGVLPASFRYLSSTAGVYLPLTLDPDAYRIARWLNSNMELIARLKPGATLDEARAQIDAHDAAMLRDFPQAKEVTEAGFRTGIVPLRADHVEAIRPTLWLLQAGALFLLCMCGVNVVNLLLIRAGARAKEMAIRRSLGATRARIAGQTILETALLTILGGIGGLMMGGAAIQGLAAMGVEQLPLGARVVFDARLAVVALAGTGLFGLMIGLPIAWFHLQGRLARALASEGRGGTDQPAAQRLRHGFIVAQIALAFVLLTGAGLLGLSLGRALAVPLGFRPDHVLAGRIALPSASYPQPSDGLAFTDRLLAELSREPGMVAAGVINDVPVNGVHDNNAMTVAGYQAPPGVSPLLHPRYGVTGEYFTAMGIPLREGRYLESADSHLEARACVVDEKFARHYWPDGNALGRRIFEGPTSRPDDQAFTVVGVVGAVKQSGPTARDEPGAIYFPYPHLARERVFVVTRTQTAPAAFAASLRGAVRRVDADLPVEDLRTMETRVADSLAAQRSPAWLTAGFAGVALLLAALGTYGVLSYAVARRGREIGVRKALGALPRHIRSLFLGLGLRLVAAGLATGAVGAAMAASVMRGMLFGVPTLHAGVFISAATIMGITAVLACWLPARRAAQVDPMTALRSE